MKARLKKSFDIASEFEYLKQLAQNDPAAFEKKRERIVRQFIESAPEDKRQMLDRVQWRVEQERNRASNPVASCIAISKMMWDALTTLNERQVELLNYASKGETPPVTPPRTNNVLSFDRCRSCKKIEEQG